MMTSPPPEVTRTDFGMRAQRSHCLDVEACSRGKRPRRSTPRSGTNASVHPFWSTTFRPGLTHVKVGDGITRCRTPLQPRRHSVCELRVQTGRERRIRWVRAGIKQRQHALRFLGSPCAAILIAGGVLSWLLRRSVSLRGNAIVMVKPTKHWRRDDLAAFTVDLAWTWNRDLLNNPLVRATRTEIV